MFRQAPGSRHEIAVAGGLSSPPHPRQPHPRGRPLAQHLAPEDEQLGRTAAGLDVLAGAFDEAGVFDQAAEVLLVEAHAGEGFDHPLELEQGEGGRQELEDDRAVLELAAQPAEGGGEDAPVVEGHGPARQEVGAAGGDGTALVGGAAVASRSRQASGTR